MLESVGLKPDFKSMEVVRKVRSFREELHQSLCGQKVEHVLEKLPELSALVRESTRNYFRDSYKAETNQLKNPVQME